MLKTLPLYPQELTIRLPMMKFRQLYLGAAIVHQMTALIQVAAFHQVPKLLQKLLLLLQWRLVCHRVPMLLLLPQ